MQAFFSYFLIFIAISLFVYYNMAMIPQGRGTKKRRIRPLTGKVLRYMFGSFDIGLDLGTSTVLVYVKGKGIVLREPSVVAIDKNTGRALAFGTAAQEMIGRTPGNILAVHPLRDGVISDYGVTRQMIREYIDKVCGFRLRKPRLVVSVPCGITEVEERAVFDAGSQAGARNVYLIEEPLAAAIGAGLDIYRPVGSMVVDIGGGTTDVAVISLNGLVESSTIRTAGVAFNEALIKYVKNKHKILIGDRTAEDLKLSIGCVHPSAQEREEEAKGRCLVTGLPKSFTISSAEMLEAFEETAGIICDEVHNVLERTPPELVGDIAQNGILLTGGGSQLAGFDKLITVKTGIFARVADDPVDCVANGCGKSLDDIADLQDSIMRTNRKTYL